jgi:hypothetical protein
LVNLLIDQNIWTKWNKLITALPGGWDPLTALQIEMQ